MAKQENLPGFTCENLKSLEDAMAQGVKKVKYSDKEIEYMSYEEMSKLRRSMRLALGKESRSCRVTQRYNKGLC